MGNNHYDYSDAREFCESQGLQFAESWVPDIDRVFYELALTQHEVNVLMRNYIVRVKQLFNPKAYPIRSRLYLALWFLFGKWKD